MSVDPRPWIIDVSKHQGRVDFPLAYSEGYQGAIVKLTEGTGYIDPYGERNLRSALKTMDIVGAYHFLWGGMSPRKQALHFVERVSRVTNPRDILLFVDVEISENMSPSQYPTAQEVDRFVSSLQDFMPRKKLGIYAGGYWRGKLGNPSVAQLDVDTPPLIWDARYFSTRLDYGSVLYKAVPESYWGQEAFGGESADILQFASTAVLKQFPDGIDVNATRDTLDDLKRLVG